VIGHKAKWMDQRLTVLTRCQTATRYSGSSL